MEHSLETPILSFIYCRVWNTVYEHEYCNLVTVECGTQFINTNICNQGI
jgi:hypothetical protein